MMLINPHCFLSQSEAIFCLFGSIFRTAAFCAAQLLRCTPFYSTLAWTTCSTTDNEQARLKVACIDGMCWEPFWRVALLGNGIEHLGCSGVNSRFSRSWLISET
jgi:hypothetical protein